MSDSEQTVREKARELLSPSEEFLTTEVSEERLVGVTESRVLICEYESFNGSERLDVTSLQYDSDDLWGMQVEAESVSEWNTDDLLVGTFLACGGFLGIMMGSGTEGQMAALFTLGGAVGILLGLVALLNAHTSHSGIEVVFHSENGEHSIQVQPDEVDAVKEVMQQRGD